MSLISIIIPVYFNASSLKELSQHLAHLSQQFPKHEFEFIYVDDGSGDASFQRLQEIANSDDRIRLIKLARNFGSNVAILAGMTYARGDCVGFIAADLQDPPETLHAMIQEWELGHKVILASRKDRSGDPLATRIFANIFNYLFKTLVYHGFSPQGIGFFLIDREVKDVLIRCEEKNAHLIGLIFWTGYPYKLVEYERKEREFGKSRWTLQKKIKYFIDAFVAFSYVPLRLSSTLGIILALLGGIYAIIITFARVFNGIQVEGWTALMVTLLILSGVQLIMLGVIGEYLWRSFDAARKRPIFIVDKVIEKSITSK